MKTFKTEGEIKAFMLDYTGLLSTEYDVHTEKTIYPDGKVELGEMYITFKDPLSKWGSIYSVFKTMLDHGYDVNCTDADGPECIIARQT